MNKKVPIEVSARHIHPSQKDIDVLFGTGYELKRMKSLTQPSDFAAEETVDIQVGEKMIKKIRVVGPTRNQTQIELAKTDCLTLGVDAPIRISGDLGGSAGAVLVGPKGNVELKEGVIIAARHLHCATSEAKSLKLKNGTSISVRVFGARETTFHNVVVRAGDDYRLCLHLDTDEGNAAGISRTTEGIIVKA